VDSSALRAVRGDLTGANPVDRDEAVDSADEARDLAAEKRLELRRGTWQGRRRGRLPFSRWADEWWELYSTDPDSSPNTLAITESRLRLHVRPWFGERPIECIGPADIRRWQRDLAAKVDPATLRQCRSLTLRIFQFALDEGAIDTNPVRKVPAPKRRADPDLVLRPGKRRALTPVEAGQLLACFPLFWWDHVITLLGTGLRIGELAGLHRRRVHLNQPIPTLQVVDVRYQAGRQFGSGFKPRPKSDASIREIPLAPQVVEAIRRRLPSGNDPAALLFTGPGGGPGQRGGPGVKKGTRTMLSRHNFRRTYHGALAKLTNPATAGLRPTAARVLKALRAHGPLTAEQLAARLTTQDRTARVATIDQALAELAAAGAATADPQTQRWMLQPAAHHPLLDAVDLHGAHDFRHTFSTWLEDAGYPCSGHRRADGPPGGPDGIRPAPSVPTTATPPRRWPPAWWSRSSSAWSSSWPRPRPTSISNPGNAESVRPATLRHLLADCWQTTLDG
jgi:integrase